MDRIKLVSIILISVLVGAVLVLIGFSFVAEDFFDTSSVTILSVGKPQKNADSETKDSDNTPRMLKYQNKEYGFEFEFPDTYLITQNTQPGPPIEFPVGYMDAYSFDMTPSIVRLDVLEDINNLNTNAKDEIKAGWGNSIYIFRIKEDSASQLFEKMSKGQLDFFEEKRLDEVKCKEKMVGQSGEECEIPMMGGANYSTTTIAGIDAIDLQIGGGGGSRSFFILPSKGIAIGPFESYFADNPWRHKYPEELINSLKRSLTFIDNK